MLDEKKRGRPAKIDADETHGTVPGWKPSSLLGTLKAKSGFHARWVSSDPANIAKKRSEGWIIMKPEDNVGSYQQAESSLSGELRYRDLVAMMLPSSLKKSREEYYKNEVREATASILKQTDASLKQSGVSTYTPSGQAGRIVIE